MLINSIVSTDSGHGFMFIVIVVQTVRSSPPGSSNLRVGKSSFLAGQVRSSLLINYKNLSF